MSGAQRVGPWEPYIAALSLVGIIWHFAARGSQWPLLAVLGIGGAPLVVTLLRKVVRGEFGSDFLAGISILTSVALGEYLAGSVIVLMLAGGASLESLATRRASSVLHALAKRMPHTAHRKAGSKIDDIPLEQVNTGDLLVVLPHESCPADGTVLEGQGMMDEAYLTGEPYRISKSVGSDVLSGAMNGDTALTIRVDRLPVDSRYSKIVLVMQQAELTRPQFRRIGDRLGAWYTVAALSVAAIAWLASRDPSRFLAVLVIATPCPLLLAIPVAIIGAISVAASRAIVIKNPAMLERIGSCRTMIFDKTGTLTYGQPALTEVGCAAGMDRNTALRLAASLEQYSKHPLASAIRNAASDAALVLSSASQMSEKPGNGLTGLVGQTAVRITGRKKLLEESANWADVLPSAEAGMEAILLVDASYAATFRFRDAPRKDSLSFIRHLGPKHGVKRLILLSGDREAEVRYLARQVGISEVLYGQSPEQKLAVVKNEAKQASTLFLGDGINDAPAMQAATVGIAFGQNSDITAEAADAVILDASLSKVDELIHIGRRMKRIALQSALGGMALSMVGMLAAATGHLSPIEGAIAQEIIDVAAVLNAVRVAVHRGEPDTITHNLCSVPDSG